jgi:hypothetical protein
MGARRPHGGAHTFKPMQQTSSETRQFVAGNISGSAYLPICSAPQSFWCLVLSCTRGNCAEQVPHIGQSLEHLDDPNGEVLGGAMTRRLIEYDETRRAMAKLKRDIVHPRWSGRLFHQTEVPTAFLVPTGGSVKSRSFRPV